MPPHAEPVRVLPGPDIKALHLSPETGERAAGIYVHIPFCRSKCPYCSFVSFQNMSDENKNRYMAAIEHQALAMASHPWAQARKFHSLFIGGGTPSFVDTDKMAAFIRTCLAAFNFSAMPDREPEVTLEVNPNAINGSMLRQFRQGGVNRLSIGVQAFSDTMLRNIGRTHTTAESANAFEAARAAGFNDINLDLMYGLPGQDLRVWEQSLQQAVALAPEHLSIYELTIEPETPFAELVRRHRLSLPPEKATLAMFVRAQEVLATAGYEQYEISNYSRRGFACIHNINYWENGAYIGLGSGAVSCISGVRLKSTENPLRFTQMINTGQAVYSEAEFLPLEARFRETVIMGLRMTAGVSISGLAARFGMTPQKYYGNLIDKLKDQELLEDGDDTLRLTGIGLLLANRVMAQLV